MEVSPCSYDFVTFLFSAEICRVRRKMDTIKLVLVHGPNEKFRLDTIRSNQQNQTFFDNVVVPAVSLLPQCISFMWVQRDTLSLESVDPIFIFPRGYKIEAPTREYQSHELVSSRVRGDAISYLTAPQYAKNFVADYVKSISNGKPIITLTAREIERDNTNQTRNLNLEVWRNALTELKKSFTPIVIRDSFSTYKEPLFENIIECPQASTHLPFRMALYEHAAMNFTKNTGPGTLLLSAKTNLVYFNEFDEDVVAVTANWFKIHFGMLKGGQFPMTSISKRVVWDSEDVETIITLTENRNDFNKNNDKLNPFGDANQQMASFQAALGHLASYLSFNLLDEDVVLYKKIKNWRRFETGYIDSIENFLRSREEKFVPGILDKLFLKEKITSER